MLHVQVLQVATRKLLVRNNLNLAIALLADLDDVSQVTGAAFNLDAVVEELLEGGNVKDLVVGRLGAVDDELREGCQLHIEQQGYISRLSIPSS